MRAYTEVLASLCDHVIEAMRIFARAGFAHRGLSPYNILVHSGRVVFIDVPQIVDIAANPNCLDLLHRDCVSVTTWFVRHGIDVEVEALFAELVAEVY